MILDSIKVSVVVTVLTLLTPIPSRLFIIASIRAGRTYDRAHHIAAAAERSGAHLWMAHHSRG